MEEFETNGHYILHTDSMTIAGKYLDIVGDYIRMEAEAVFTKTDSGGVVDLNLVKGTIVEVNYTKVVCLIHQNGSQ